MKRFKCSYDVCSFTTEVLGSVFDVTGLTQNWIIIIEIVSFQLFDYLEEGAILFWRYRTKKACNCIIEKLWT